MKAKIRIEYNGKTYRIGKSWRCASKRDCDLYTRGWCDNEQMVSKKGLPCDPLADALIAATGSTCKTCFKEAAK